MNSYVFTTNDKFEGFMFALQALGVCWASYDERLGIELRPITEKDFNLYEKENGNISINFHEEGISWSNQPVITD